MKNILNVLGFVALAAIFASCAFFEGSVSLLEGSHGTAGNGRITGLLPGSSYVLLDGKDWYGIVSNGDVHLGSKTLTEALIQALPLGPQVTVINHLDNKKTYGVYMVFKGSTPGEDFNPGSPEIPAVPGTPGGTISNAPYAHEWNALRIRVITYNDNPIAGEAVDWSTVDEIEEVEVDGGDNLYYLTNAFVMAIGVGTPNLFADGIQTIINSTAAAELGTDIEFVIKAESGTSATHTDYAPNVLQVRVIKDDSGPVNIPVPNAAVVELAQAAFDTLIDGASNGEGSDWGDTWRLFEVALDPAVTSADDETIPDPDNPGTPGTPLIPAVPPSAGTPEGPLEIILAADQDRIGNNPANQFKNVGNNAIIDVSGLYKDQMVEIFQGGSHFEGITTIIFYLGNDVRITGEANINNYQLKIRDEANEAIAITFGDDEEFEVEIVKNIDMNPVTARVFATLGLSYFEIRGVGSTSYIQVTKTQGEEAPPEEPIDP